MFILPSNSNSLELWSVNDTSMHENSELKVFGEISSNWTNDLLGTKVYKTLESYW